MNCREHPGLVSVAQCRDCGSGLCVACANVFSIPSCRSCARGEASQVRGRRLRQLALAAALFAAGALWARSFAPSVGEMLLAGYVVAAFPSGWAALNRITPDVFLIMPLVGWLLYALVKAALAFFIGPVMAPIRLVRGIRDWRRSTGLRRA